MPCLVSRELVSNQENDNSEIGRFDKGSADLHKARWGPLFDQMENALSEEEKHLVSRVSVWLQWAYLQLLHSFWIL